MVIRQHQHSKIFALLIVFLLVLTSCYFVPPRSVSGLSRACQNSPECLAAVEREREANRNAAMASRSVSLFEVKVQALNVEIASQIAAIAKTTSEVEELTAEITKTKAKLTTQRAALAQLMVDIHFDNSEDAILILAGSGSISDLAERQSREEVAKKQITASAAAIKKMKEKLEADKARVEQLLAEQQAAKTNLEIARQNQQALVDKYRNNAKAYEEAAKQARDAQRQAELAEQQKHPERYHGTAYSGINTYPWQADCPGRQDEYASYLETSPGDWNVVGGLVCECVSYVGWKAYERHDKVIAWGNAYSWDDTARNLGYLVDHNPAPDTIGQVDGGPYGHVFWVESVNADGSINVTEYNNWYSTGLYSGNQHPGDFGARTISAFEARSYNYIHL